MQASFWLLAAVAGVISGAALAADDGQPPIMAPATADGLYLSLHGGALLIPYTDVVVLGGSARFGSDPGYRVGGSVGYDFNSTFGIEGEVSYGSVRVSTLDGMAIPDSHANILTLMGNLILGQEMGMWRPYVGVGGGIARVNPIIDIGGGNGMNDTDTTWAAQGFVGVDVRLSRNLSVGGRYRYQYIGSTDYLDFDDDPVTIDHISAHSVEAVLKVRFGG
jgi:opacity protein-like surface antigen